MSLFLAPQTVPWVIMVIGRLQLQDIWDKSFTQSVVHFEWVGLGVITCGGLNYLYYLLYITFSEM